MRHPALAILTSCCSVPSYCCHALPSCCLLLFLPAATIMLFSYRLVSLLLLNDLLFLSWCYLMLLLLFHLLPAAWCTCCCYIMPWSSQGQTLVNLGTEAIGNQTPPPPPNRRSPDYHGTGRCNLMTRSCEHSQRENARNKWENVGEGYHCNNSRCVPIPWFFVEHN